MQTDFLFALRRRLARAAQGAQGKFLNFEGDRSIWWGFETRQAGEAYYWDGLKRRLSFRRPQILFQFTLQGLGEYEEKGRRWPLAPGTGFLTLLPSAHAYYLPEGSASWTFFWFIVRHPFAGERIRELRASESAVQPWGDDSPALDAAAALFELACQGGMRDVWAFEQPLFTWLLAVERELHQRRYPAAERLRLLRETRAWVRERMARSLGVAQMAAAHDSERTTFSRKFKAMTGTSPASFITEVRLEEALKLLRSDAKLEKIASETGFADANHFCKVFRRRFHISPGLYRQLIGHESRNRL